ncbi:hypothetical protein [Futiania mangrovi]|uniref:DUF11 domain-containing protein n=1 Tax=Futiania mangrovi TaxID=2959716 RepID=A0A9J6P8E8_9PROT|nr:hypothetical protein [Futiania mangrovii]MCP1335940.1 hypothetical protein [Futiania mangrovii]
MRRLLPVIGILASLAAAPAFANRIEVQNIPEKEVVTTNAQGEKVVTRVPATRVVPGEEVIYTIRYKNAGDKAAENIVVTSAVPEQMTYRDGTAEGAGATVLFSVDDGRTFGPWNTLFVKGPDGKDRQATAEDYTHIRFILTTPVPAETAGAVSYRAVLN